MAASGHAPRWGGAGLRAVGRAILRVLGWRAVGDLPDVPKMVIIVAPHSSNWDFIVGIAYMMSRNVAVRFIGKRELFRWPLGVVMRHLGGIPVDRANPQAVVEQVVAEFAGVPGIVLGITPEGTRKRGATWKTGYYRIAKDAGVPIVPGFIDWFTKQVGVLPPFLPTGDQARDLAHLQGLYAGFRRSDDPKPAGNGPA